MSIQRWTKIYVQDPDEHENWSAPIVRADDGPWVLFADHESELSALRGLAARLQGELWERLEEAAPLSGDPRAPLPGWVNRVRYMLSNPSAQATEEWLRERERAAVRKATEALRIVIAEEFKSLIHGDCSPDYSSRCIAKRIAQILALQEEVPHAE